MNSRRIVVVGGGAAGFFGAITCAEANPRTQVTLLEKGSHFLAKVRISGGGRCNVTHACFEPRELTTRYPRGERALIAPFQRFQARDTVDWFAKRGVTLKVEKDGRMFPTTDSSETIIACLTDAARRAGVVLRAGCGADRLTRTPAGDFCVSIGDGKELRADCVLLATGGCRAPALGQLAVSLGHTLVPPVPSLFTFNVPVEWVRALSGVAVEDVLITVAGAGLRERGALLLTHWGLSGPAVLRLSAWGARWLHDQDYRFQLLVNWLPARTEEEIARECELRRKSSPAKQVANTPISPLSARLWEQLIRSAEIDREARWATFSKADQTKLVRALTATAFLVEGKSLNKDEFVTCGGVPLKEVNFRTMESRICPGLFFAGELLDIDGITGGFNFQAAWTTGWIAGNSMAGHSRS